MLCHAFFSILSRLLLSYCFLFSKCFYLSWKSIGNNLSIIQGRGKDCTNTTLPRSRLWNWHWYAVGVCCLLSSLGTLISPSEKSMEKLINRQCWIFYLYLLEVEGKLHTVSSPNHWFHHQRMIIYWLLTIVWAALSEKRIF